MNMVTGLFFLTLWIIIPVALLSSILALFLRMACSLLGEKGPSFRHACAIGATALFSELALACLLLWTNAAILWPPSAIALAAYLYGRMLPLRYTRALLVAVVQVLIVGGGVWLLGLVMAPEILKATGW